MLSKLTKHIILLLETTCADLTLRSLSIAILEQDPLHPWAPPHVLCMLLCIDINMKILLILALCINICIIIIYYVYLLFDIMDAIIYYY